MPVDPAGDATRRDERTLRHEVRTHLNHIIGYSEMLGEEVADLGEPRLLGDLQKIRASAVALLETLEEHLRGTQATPSDRGIEAAPGPLHAGSLPDEEGALPEFNPGAGSGRSPARRLAGWALEPAGQETLLVVDDDAASREMVERRMQGEGYRVLAAAGGREALDIVAREPVDLVLLDVLMPDMSGLAVLKELRARHRMTDLPVIMATALHDSEDMVRALHLGANDYVTKPLDFLVVLARVETHLSLRNAAREIARLAHELEARNAFMRAAFDRYLSAEIVERLLEAPGGLQLGGQLRTVTVLMSDIRGFTSLSQWLEPQQVVRLLNRYLGTMADIVRECHGTVDEFIGDSVLALFGAPVGADDDARRAVACAIKMQRAMEGVNRLNREEGLPLLQMGIAVHTGEVIVGNIGSQTRAKYGAVGSPVNEAARIESCTVGGQILISERTLQGAGAVVRVGDRLSIEAKGVRDPIVAYNVMGMDAPYHLVLPRHAVAMRDLEREIAVTCFVVEGKRVAGRRYEGSLVRLSLDGAVLRLATGLLVLSNLRMQLRGYGGDPIEGSLYAKIVACGQEGAGCCTLRFTAMAPQVETFLKLVLAKAPEEKSP